MLPNKCSLKCRLRPKQWQQMKGNRAPNRSLASGLQDEPPALEPPAPCLHLLPFTGLCCVFQARAQKLSLGRFWPLSCCIRALLFPSWTWMPSGSKAAGTQLVLSQEVEDRKIWRGGESSFWLLLSPLLGHCKAGGLVSLCVHVRVYVCAFVHV